MNRFSALIAYCLTCSGLFAQSGIRITLEEAQSIAAERAYAVRYATMDTEEAASTTRETIASGFPQVSGTIDYNRYIDIPTQVAPADAFGFPDYLTAFLGGVAHKKPKKTQ
jgi:outer membrane protein